MSINSTAYQLDIFTQQPHVAGDVVDRIRYLLRTHRDARNDYKVLVARYWFLFDGLEHVFLADDFVTAFIEWMQYSATSAKTIQNRAMELQSAYPELDADPEIRARCQKQATQGPIRR
jgi:hypothetical protein